MSNFDGRTVSRRTVLYAAAAGSGVLLGGLVPVGGATAAASNSTAYQGGRTIADMDAFLDIDGVRAEYQQAIVAFPLNLPDGWSFPPDSRQQDEGPGVMWEKGNGVAEAYFFWQFAVASAAHEAHLRGEEAEAARFLDVLEAGYSTPLRRAIVDDPEGAFVTEAVGPVRGGGAAARGSASKADFGPLMHAVAP